MKETVKTFVILVLVILVVFLSVKSMKYYQKSQEKPEPVILTDTIVNVEWDTVYLERYKTVKLRTTDTTICYITDTVKRVDSVFVEVPISVYKLDTTLTTDTTCMNIRIQNSGYAVKLDSLSYNFKYTPTKTKTNFFKEHFKFGVGIGTGFGCFSKQLDVFIGGGFYYVF